MPDFSLAISSKVFPKALVWSNSMQVITLISGFTILVGALCPPALTSITATSTYYLSKYIKPKAAKTIEKLGFISFSSIFYSKSDNISCNYESVMH